MTELDKIEGLKGTLKFDEPMSRYTSWRIGGPADRFFVPRDLDDLRYFLAHLPVDEPLTWIGLGSNLLIRDKGIRGTVIATRNVMDELEQPGPGQISAGSGVPCAKLARYSVRAGLAGAEFLVGIPGTLGGALAMNAGAFGSETWEIIKQVKTVNRKGEIHIRDKSEFTIAYRSVSGPEEEWFVSALAELPPDHNHTGNNTIRELLARRSETQPMGEASCGSVFRNPGSDTPAAKLIDSCGLKGKYTGQARISDKHANFIINTGTATAADIEALIKHVQEVVFEKYQVMLVPEVRVIGDK
ncbi:MAG: UDP-N-acetylmuramate dehydrogenase [Gammaproteobacteria bacterium]